MYLEHTDAKQQIWACYLIIGPIVCIQFLWPFNGNTHDWETWASHVYLGRTQVVVLACPVVSWPTTLANTAGISQLDTSKGESEKEWKLAGEKAFWTWLKQNFPLLTRKPEYMGSAAS